ncbi:transposase [Micromonospora sp. LOL_023]|uniref:transposase n=1 Tax=Micromonospora sp. LOL_023 TaxID=3345418 RepID=UPI003A884DCB
MLRRPGRGRLTVAYCSVARSSSDSFRGYIEWSRPPPDGASSSTVTVSQDPAGHWFVSLLCDDTIDRTPAADTVGVDAGLDSLLTLSTGEKVANPEHERADRHRLARAQPAMTKKEKGSGLSVAAGEGGVGPQRGNLRSGQPTVKQETQGRPRESPSVRTGRMSTHRPRRWSPMAGHPSRTERVRHPPSGCPGSARSNAAAGLRPGDYRPRKG